MTNKFTSGWDFQRPKRHRVVFLGASGESLLRTYITEDDIVVYRSPRQVLNLWVAIYALLRGTWTIRGYYRAFLRIVKPKFVVTFEDNALEFYLTKLYWPDCKTLCIQNGRRDSFSTIPQYDLWQSVRALVPKNRTPDVIFAHGEPAVAHYKTAVGHGTTRIASVGSVRNNSLELSKYAGDPRLFFVSSFPNLGNDGDLELISEKILGYWQKEPVTFGQFYRSEGLVASVAAAVARDLEMQFFVLGKRPAWQRGEWRYFDKSLPELPWTYLPAEVESSSYEAVSLNDVVINIDSTLGYELFSRGVRVAFVSGRMGAADKAHIRECEFAHPLVSEPTGTFWTNQISTSEIIRVSKAVISMTTDEWSESSSRLRELVMPFDFKNMALCKMLTNLGIENSGPRFWDTVTISAN